MPTSVVGGVLPAAAVAVALAAAAEMERVWWLQPRVASSPGSYLLPT